MYMYVLRVASLLADTVTCGSFKYDISVSSFWENAQAHNLESYLILYQILCYLGGAGCTKEKKIKPGVVHK